MLDKSIQLIYNNQYIQNILKNPTENNEVIKMVKKDQNNSCCSSSGMDISCCKVESVVSVDDRGQMVLPKEIRDKADIQAGDKLAIVTWERDNEVCCISLIKVESLAEMVKGILGPVMKDILK